MKLLIRTDQFSSISDFCHKHNLLKLDKDNIMRIPFLIKGKIRIPKDIKIEEIKKAKEKYEIAMAVGQELFDFVKDQGPEVKLTACDTETCRWQIEKGTQLPSRHPIEILAAAYGLYDLDERVLTNE